MRRFFLLFLALTLLSALLLNSCIRESKGPLKVAAASNLIDAFSEIGYLYQKEKGIDVKFNFGSSGQLAAQIKNGAPVDLFASANVGYIETLQKENLILPQSKRIYALGRLVIWSRRESTVQKLEDLLGPKIKKVALANPQYNPYGVAAKEALTRIGIWKKIQPKLVFGENVRNTLQLAESGNADAAIVALSLIKENKGSVSLIPSHLHKPIKQALAVVKESKKRKEAEKFANFVTGPKGQKILRKYGFAIPEEEQ